MSNVQIERKTVDIILADQFGLIGLIDGGLEMLALADEFAAYVNVAGMGAHADAGQQTPLDQKMRIVPHDLAVLAGAGLGLVCIDDEIARTAVGAVLWHEGPFHAGRKSSPAAA